MKTGSGIAGCLLVLVATLALTTGGAAAHQSPPGCGTGALNASSPTALAVMHRDGENVEFEARYSNSSAGACDVTGFTASITFPKSDGTAGGPAETVVAGQNLTALGGSGMVSLPPISRTIDFDDGVYTGPVKVTLSGGTFHGGAVDTPYGDSSSTATLAISRPKVDLSVTADPLEIDFGSPVEYTYLATNTSTTFPGDSGFLAMTDSAIADDRCAPVTYVSGDGGVGGWLEVGETWTFTCTTTIDEIGTIANHVEYTGNYVRDGLGAVGATADGSVVVHGPDLVIDMSHGGNFIRGSDGAYSIVVTNSGDRDTSPGEDVTAVATLPAGLTAKSISGQGWNCNLATLTCGRAVGLVAGASLPPIDLVTAVAEDAPNSVTASVTVAGGGEGDPSNNADTDLAIVDPRAQDPDPGTANLDGIVLVPKAKKVKAGKKVRLTAKVTNTGTAAGTATVILKSSAKKKATVPKSFTVAVPAGQTISKKFTVKTRKKKAGKVRITARLGGKAARTVLTLKR